MKVTVLTGGVGGAKLVSGLLGMAECEVTAIVNTGDDFRHLGLYVSPDIDTLLYTLSGRANRAQGWGREGESWNFLAALRSLGGEDWFALGDGDLALHVLRSQRLAQGEPLSAIVDSFARSWEIAAHVLPMSDSRVATVIETDEGVLEFQRYFVERRCAPVVSGVRFDGADVSVPAPGVVEAIEAADVLLIAPSNPYLSVDPILAVAGVRSAIERCRAPRVAVSPIIGGEAVKGPTAKLMRELGLPVTNATIATHYRGLIDGLLIDAGDRDSTADLDVAVREADTLMQSDEDKRRVAVAAVKLASCVARG